MRTVERRSDPAAATACARLPRTRPDETAALQTEAERRHVEELGCYGGQGYLFSRPVPAEALTRLLERDVGVAQLKAA
jgi:predicted signal transduction protein with EAL and GGDEF domain